MLKPTSIEDLQTLADNAIELVKIVRQWLPGSGDSEAKTASQRTAENWFYSAAECYTVCERIRNPHKLQFGIASGQYHGPSVCSAAWFGICDALDTIAVTYRLQGVSDESGCPHLPFEQSVPAVDSGTLRRLELAASTILEAIRNETSAAESARNASDNPATAKPVQTKKRWTVPEIQEHCELAMKSQDPETIQTYLFLAGKKLAKRIGFDAKTLSETEFWKQRPQEQANWRRQNTAGLPARKRNAQ